MSRRKQARPIKHLEDDLPRGNTKTPLPTNEDSPTSCSEEDPSVASEEQLSCPRCQEQFTLVPEFLAHKASCVSQVATTIPISIPTAENMTPSDPEDMVVSEFEDDETEDSSSKIQEKDRRIKQDAANNNSVEDEGEGLPSDFPFPLPATTSHVTLEALQNTKVAVAQFAATAMANSGENEAALQELAVLQSTLFTLQHQQVFQLQLINQLQHQLKLGAPVPSSVKESEPSSPQGDVSPEPLNTSREPSPERPLTPAEVSRETTPPPVEKINTPKPEVLNETPVPSEPSTPISCPIQPPLCSISSSLAASIITNNDPPPSLDEPNTLEMLQKRAQEVLDNASQGLLANNLADELTFRKKGSLSPYDSKSGRNEPFFKHRCRYCGKVFGSDSALQIHIRSHTGERPFKCNVCGSRFTTKGNLKVHFQRHTSKFPHIKMNPNPIPEHLDKYHPPLLAQLNQSGALSPGGQGPHHPPVPFSPGHPFPPSSIPIYRPPIPPPELIQPRLPLSLQRPQEPNRVLPNFPLFNVKREEQDVPENLSKPPSSPVPSIPESQKVKSEIDEKELLERPKEAQTPTNSEIAKQEMEMYNEEENENMGSPGMYDDCSIESKYEDEELLRRSPLGLDGNEMQDEPENLSNKSSSVTTPLCISTQKLPASFNFPNAASPPSSTSDGSIGSYSSTADLRSIDPSRDPALYTSLLPRPGSNDNSWESLIEITKTSETSKLQQLVDNIEHKLTDPNQCVVCHRVLSCKSALQMHYRTHTGERPFRCKICGRAFTTKGNLKTHMGVHRAKPPMRVLHQCPVCHKKFTNALVLQQHIRLHTGEPTDLTPEQIQAAEVKEFSPPGGFPPIPNSVSPFLSGHIQVPGLSPLTATNLSLNSHLKPENLDLKNQDNLVHDDDEDMDDKMETSSCETNISKLPNFSTSLAALENQVRTITTTANQMSVNHNSEDFLSNPRLMTSTPTPQNGLKSPDRSENESPVDSEVRVSPSQFPVQLKRPPSSNRSIEPESESESLGALDLRAGQPAQSPSPGPPGSNSGLGPSPGPPGIPGFPGFRGLLPPNQPGSSPLISSALSSLTSSVLNTTAYNPLGIAVGPTIRGNTTCSLCFKTFACHSALEIHYRSHTKERPFKCTICDRGFSTKGNMKQHMLTHKIRDMPHHIFDKPVGLPPTPNSLPERSEERDRDSVPKEIPIPREREVPIPEPPPPQIPIPQPEPPKTEPIKRSTSESELPIPKRTPTGVQNSKHLCHVCNKNFSSSSALQIHMRTHTGDKPFRCTVCQKAFTTKGNLKVHMGTHMWSNGASRRGRRMSLDLPPIPMTPKDSEFLQRRPDLFYPYLPAPFLNGMQQKLNDMSVIQNPNPTKYTGLLGFGYPTPEAPRSQSPSSDKPQTRPPSHETSEPAPERDMLPRMWDLHYDRKQNSEQSLDMSTNAVSSNAPLALAPPPRGEGLAA